MLIGRLIVLTGYILYYGILSLPPKLRITFVFVKVYMKIYLHKMIDKYIWVFFSKSMQGLVYPSWLDMIVKIFVSILNTEGQDC